MTVITYGQSVFAGNAKSRRHERRRAAAIERDTIGNIIDAILGCEAPDDSQEEPRKHAGRVDKATSLVSLRNKETDGSCCLPEISLYRAGHRKTLTVTAR